MGPSIRPIRRLEVLGYQKVEADELLGCLLVPGEGFEPPTFGLQNRCTTTVLTRLDIVFATFSARRPDAELNAFVEHVQLLFRCACFSRFIAPFANVVSGRT